MKIFNRLNLEPTNINLYYQAFTHTSFSNENPSFVSYERLEFLGDAVLDLCISCHLYENLHYDEGVLTKTRANAVREEALNVYAEKIKLNTYLFLGNGEIQNGGRNRPAIIADAFEAMLGAVLLDSNFETVYDVVKRIVLPFFNVVTQFKDYKSTFQEKVQADKRTLHYEIVKDEGLCIEIEKEEKVEIEDDNKIIYDGKIGSLQREKDTVKEVRLKSPLGFYYTKRIYHSDGPKETYVGGNEHLVWIFFDKDDIRYELSYYIMNSNTRIGKETRPWEIIDNEVFEDNYIEALQAEVEKLLNISKSKCSGELDNSLCKEKPGYKNNDKYFIGDLNDVKRLIFTDLFGYPDGPKHQTNKEKILSHGFDLKTSFRNM